MAIEMDGAATGETGTTDSNREPSASQLEERPPVESTAELIMRRAEQNGDFDQFKEQKEA